MDLDDEELEATRRLHGVSEEGEYVRTIYGEITKLKVGHTASGAYYYPENRIFDGYEKCNHINYKIIAKQSKNLIDLIEEGDYVNGCKVYRVEKNTITIYQEVEGQPVDYNYLMKDEIKSIVTKEQIKQIEYRIKE